MTNIPEKKWKDGLWLARQKASGDFSRDQLIFMKLMQDLGREIQMELLIRFAQLKDELDSILS